ncbi:MAG: HAD-IA family hydrolase [Acidimicrobiia bacterium]
MTPKAILFDAGGTLVTIHPTRFGDVLEPILGGRPDTERLEDAHYLAMDAVAANPDIVAKTDWWKWWLGEFLAFAGLERRADLVEALSATRGLWQLPLPGALDGARAIREAGFAVAVVSNADGHVENDLAAAGFGDVFDVVIDSTRVGVSKPDPRIFDFALEALGVAPEECWYVGDSAIFDLQGARNAGLDVFVLVDPFGLNDHQPRVGSVGEFARDFLAAHSSVD